MSDVYFIHVMWSSDPLSCSTSDETLWIEISKIEYKLGQDNVQFLGLDILIIAFAERPDSENQSAGRSYT